MLPPVHSTVPPQEVAAEVRQQHWYGPRRVPDHRPRGSSKTTSLLRFLYFVYVGDLPADKALQRLCPDPDCINPFHHKPSARPNNGLYLTRHRHAHSQRKLALASRPEAPQEILDVVKFLTDLEENPDATSTVTLQTVLNTLAESGLSATPSEIRAALPADLSAKVLGC